ncbi:MAG: hypothetical protein BGO39_16065 [Chloroflexi bacterium 54-19]|nr:MAG: hypothetical protein BGO39_16065 [Chloroflexi bacterium 54-19]
MLHLAKPPSKLISPLPAKRGTKNILRGLNICPQLKIKMSSFSFPITYQNQNPGMGLFLLF